MQNFAFTVCGCLQPHCQQNLGGPEALPLVQVLSLRCADWTDEFLLVGIGALAAGCVAGLEASGSLWRALTGSSSELLGATGDSGESVSSSIINCFDAE